LHALAVPSTRFGGVGATHWSRRTDPVSNQHLGMLGAWRDLTDRMRYSSCTRIPTRISQW